LWVAFGAERDSSEYAKKRITTAIPVRHAGTSKQNQQEIGGADYKIVDNKHIAPAETTQTGFTGAQNGGT